MGGNWVGCFIFVGVLGCSLEWSRLHLQKVSLLKVYVGNKPDFKNVRGCATGRKKNYKLEKKKQEIDCYSKNQKCKVNHYMHMQKKENKSLINHTMYNLLRWNATIMHYIRYIVFDKYHLLMIMILKQYFR